MHPKGKKPSILTFGIYITFMSLVIEYCFTPFLELKKICVYLYIMVCIHSRILNVFPPVTQ